VTKQEIFDKVYRWFAVDGNQRSFDTQRGLCAYRGKNGARCAVGVLIPDNEYSSRFEGDSVMVLLGREKCSPTLKAISEGNERFLAELQRAHDEATNHDRLTAALRSVARGHALSIPEAPQ
jgi:hypothetical protein